ncbi:flagellar regulatory protein FliZ, partial [Escherichia coli]|nr:flagellar regulatory protein FliZ [Escherichia coli]
LAPWLPQTSTTNYLIALRKYEQYRSQNPSLQVQRLTSDIY